MEYRIPNNLKRLVFICANEEFGNSKTAEECKTCKKDYIDCWKNAIKDQIIFLCRRNNANKFQQFGQCPNCKKYGVHVEANDTYDCTCRKCGKTSEISEEEMEAALNAQYEKINLEKLEAAIEVAVQHM